MNYATTPKQDYLSTPDIATAHHKIVEDPAVRAALSAALAEMQHRAVSSTPADNFNACAASHLRMLGAKDLIAIFLNLCETETPAARVDGNNLPGNVRQMPQQPKRS